ncbi:sensor histidine kinase [Cohnella terricola]|nr:HAMP domain-containing sensor histidine kinase [Cohnella terricola]
MRKIRYSWRYTIRWRLLLIILSSLGLTAVTILVGYFLTEMLVQIPVANIPFVWIIENYGSNRAMIVAGTVIFPFAFFPASAFLVQDLQKLDAGLQEIANGRFEHQAAVKGKNELSAIADSMNKLSVEWDHELREITRGLEEIAKGNFNYQIPKVSGSRLGEVAFSINRMSGQLKSSIDEERRAEKTKNDLITGVSHDLRTPLTSILGFLEVIEEDRYQDETELRYYVNIAYEKSLALRKLIDQLFEYTRINNGIPLDLSELDLVGLIRQLVEEFVPVLEQAGMECRLNVHEGDFTMLADGGLLVRGYENLLSNAIRYGHTGKYIDIDFFIDGKEMVVRLQNYGEPIPELELPFIFDRFYRVERSRSKETGGTGLGLAITKSILEIQGGSINAQSSKKATSFETRFPIREKAETAAE